MQSRQVNTGNINTRWPQSDQSVLTTETIACTGRQPEPPGAALSAITGASSLGDKATAISPCLQERRQYGVGGRD
ncbi:hypothetical protein ACOMHN_013032 [Nucella lapillus]